MNGGYNDPNSHKRSKPQRAINGLTRFEFWSLIGFVFVLGLMVNAAAT